MTDPLRSGFDHGPGTSGDFGALARWSGRMLNALGHAQITGAGNLLKKAIRDLTTGDAQRAEQLILRAAQMPYDDREEGSPGVRAASMLVYRLITDQLEASKEDDMTWLDVVLAMHPGLDPTGRADVASVVHGFVLQPALFAVSPAEKRRIHQAFSGAPPRSRTRRQSELNGRAAAGHHQVTGRGRGGVGRGLRRSHATTAGVSAGQPGRDTRLMRRGVDVSR